jgi:hypothetical protein
MVRRKIITLVFFFGSAMLFELAGPTKARAAGSQDASATQPTTPQEVWQKEFEDICSRTQEAMTYSPEELTRLIQRCDALLTRADKLNDTQKKVYLGRLRMCRGLYAYVLESKIDEKK